MPTYKYECLECKGIFFVLRSILSDKEVDCEFCHEKCSNVVITGGADIIDKTPKTLGSLAEKNTKKFGKEYCEQKTLEHKARNVKAKQTMREVPGDGVRAEKVTESYTPPWRKGPIDPSLVKLTPEQQKRYVKNGTKPV